MDVRVRREHIDDLQLVPDTNFEVRLVVRRRDLQRTGPELDVHMIVRDDRNRRMRERPVHRAADVFHKARILRVYRHRHVAHQRFRTGRRNFEILARRVRQLVFHEIQLRALRRHDDLLVGQCR